jgi:cytochrome c oxidase assembly protein subunit 11
VSAGPATTARRNRRTATVIAAVVVGMVGLSFASVPLYRLFCQVTGYGGTTQRADAPTEAAGTRMLTVRFDASIGGRDLPWTFEPEVREMKVRVGEQHLAFYRAHNKSSQPVIGTATFNVTPHKAGVYFDKVACFCFTEQRLDPGESAELGVSFYVDPKMADDPNLADVNTITLSYTFFRAQHDAARPSTVGLNSRTPVPAVN